MNNVIFLEKNCPEALKDFENLTKAAISLKFHLKKVVKEGNDKLINDAIIFHVKQSIGESYEEGLKAMIEGGIL